MALMSQESVTAGRWTRAEYDRLVELRMFDGERLELLDGLPVVHEPQKSPHAATVTQAGEVLRVAFGAGWPARDRDAAASPRARITVADLLP